MPLATILAPASQPVTLPQVKQHLRIDHSDDDSYLGDLIEAATLHVEARIGQVLIVRTLRQFVSDIPASRTISLEAWPVKEITAVTGYDLAGNPSLLTADSYKLDAAELSELVFTGRARLAGFVNGLEVDFIAGYGETTLDVPSNIIRAILVLVAHWYEFRGTLAGGDQTASIPEGLNALLEPARRVKL